MAMVTDVSADGCNQISNSGCRSSSSCDRRQTHLPRTRIAPSDEHSVYSLNLRTIPMSLIVGASSFAQGCDLRRVPDDAGEFLTLTLDQQSGLLDLPGFLER